MKGLRVLGMAALVLLPGSDLLAQGRQAENRNRSPFRWSGIATWEYYQTRGERSGSRNEFDSLRQKYSVDVSGFLWDPRVNQFSLGLDLFVTDQDNEGVKNDTDGVGYRFLSTVFPNSPLPFRLFARKAVTDITGAALGSSDRETSAWGMQLDLVNRAWSKLHMRYERSAFDILSPLALEERRDTALFDFAKKYNSNDFTFRYNLYENKERVNQSDMNRNDFNLTDLKRFSNGATLNLTAHYLDSRSRFSGGNFDDLNTTRVGTRFDLPRGEKNNLGLNYEFLDTDGMFLDASSHIGSANARFWMGRGFSSTSTLSYGLIQSTDTTGKFDQTLFGIATGLVYRKELSRSSVDASYALGYDDSRFDTGVDRQSLNHRADFQYRLAVTDTDEFHTSLSYSLDDNDTTGLAFTRDEFRVTTGWEGQLQGSRRYRTSASYRDSRYDTFQFGLQESDEIAFQGSLDFRRGGLSLALAFAEGVSDFVPDPAAVGPFLPGTDLVSNTEVVSAGAHWRILRNLRFQFQARLENREFTTTGKEKILSYHPQIDYYFFTWQISAGYSFYERSNGTEFTDDTILLKISKRFF